MSDDQKMVSVPLALLRLVLAEAEVNSDLVEHDRACSSADRKDCEAERERIEQLRKIAGIDDAD